LTGSGTGSNRANADGSNRACAGLDWGLAGGRRVGTARRRSRGSRLIGEAGVDGGAWRRGTIRTGRGLQAGGRLGDRSLRQTERINCAGRGSTDTGGGWCSRLAIRSSIIVRQRTRGKKGRAFVAIQSAMLTGQEVSATFLTHSRRAERSIGFACRHFGEEAFEREDKLKPKFSREAKQEKEVILYTKKMADGYIDAARSMTTKMIWGGQAQLTQCPWGEYSVEREIWESKR